MGALPAADAGAAPDALLPRRTPTGGPGPVADLESVLQQLAASGLFDGGPGIGEGRNVVSLGAAISNARLPPELGGLDGQDFFDRPRSLFLVVYLQPLARPCAITDAACQVNGRSVSDILTEADGDGKARWLQYRTGGMPIENIVHVAIDTKEGESVASFRSRCGNIPMFPKNLFDVMEPSPAAYYGPLVTALGHAHSGTGQSADLCDLFGAEGELDIVRLSAQIASMAGPPPGN
jgi:hypothetical protein